MRGIWMRKAVPNDAIFCYFSSRRKSKSLINNHGTWKLHICRHGHAKHLDTKDARMFGKLEKRLARSPMKDVRNFRKMLKNQTNSTGSALEVSCIFQLWKKSRGTDRQGLPRRRRDAHLASTIPLLNNLSGTSCFVYYIFPVLPIVFVYHMFPVLRFIVTVLLLTRSSCMCASWALNRYAAPALISATAVLIFEKAKKKI